MPRPASTPRPSANPAAHRDCQPAASPATTLPTKSHPFVRATIAAWRALTDGQDRRDTDRGTLLACSAGADSTALAVALARANAPFTLAHIRHDLRTDAETSADRYRVRDLAKLLGRPFAEASVAVAEIPGNAEANARRARYEALANLAADAGHPFVATAHHADDQLETVLMRLLRGAGPRGLAGIRPTRKLSHDRTLIRPMLALDPADARAMLDAHAIPWNEDHTNQDLTRTRAALRARVLPVLKDIRPAAPVAAARSAQACADLDSAIAAIVQATPADRTRASTTWQLADLIKLPHPLLADLLAREATRFHDDTRDLPDLPRRERRAAAAWIASARPGGSVRFGPVELNRDGQCIRMTHLLWEGGRTGAGNSPKGPPLGHAPKGTALGGE